MDTAEKINAVQRMQDFIETHLFETVTLNMLAREARYSQWHSARIFKELTGKAPFEYIRMLRLSKAALRLRDNQTKIVDVALDFVFDSHEGFTRAFSKEFNMTPAQYCREKPPIQLFIPYSIRGYYTFLKKGEEKMNQKSQGNETANAANTVFVQVMERPARKLILKSGNKAEAYFEYCEEVGCDIWGVLTSVKEALYEPIGMWLPENLRKPGTSKYVQGVEVPLNYNGLIPEGFEIIELKPCKMIIFQGQPYEDEHFQEAIAKAWEAIETYNPEIYGFKYAEEDGPRFQLAPMGYRGYIEGRPVRRLSE
ncbi:MAG: AraC family transcriptional regulator [Eubacterium sp.]|nr:AraC family transcriptional regulator [Eubacterium sp.]